MVTKWKNISEKLCGTRRNRILLWGAVFASLVLFFWSLGFAASGGIGLSSFTYLKDDSYLSSEYHAGEVREAFREVRNKCLDDTERFRPDNDWELFQGVYEFRQTKATSLNRNNIPKEAYEDFIRELGKSSSDETGEEEEIIREVPAAVKDNVRRGEALWYFRKNLPCYYRWNGENYSAYGDGALLSEELLGEMDPMGADERITIGYTEEMIRQGEQVYSGIVSHVYIGCGGMLIGVLALFTALIILIPDVYRNRRGRRYYDMIALAALYALCTLPARLRELILPDYLWTTFGGEILTELFPIVCSVAAVSGMMLFSTVHLVCLAVGLGRAGKGRFLSIIKRERGFIYRCIMDGKRRITGEAYFGKGIAECSRKRLRFTLLLSGVFALCGMFGAYIGVIGGIWWQSGFLIVCIEVIFLGRIWYVYDEGTKKIHTEYAGLTKQIDRLCEGNYTSHQTPAEFSLFEEEACKLSMLGCQMQVNIRKQVQAEKMKMELITNVSHDLKTPLTSLISYIDLLSKEDLSPVAADYVKILERKSGHLRKMVSDVFDLSKASSGNLEIKKERVELNRLLVQTLADMEREIEQAPAKVVTQLSDTIGVLNSDGNKLYRVLQNILQNALKYSMRDTRIFVTLLVEKRAAVLRVKNVAGYEMNFTAEDVMGRFFRGDKARSTEGSGLGLAIAKEFSELCGGEFSVDISGDVFCVEIRFRCDDVIAL